jgi:hypothetical protein
MIRDCAHGHLARSCEICKRDESISELERVLKRASFALLAGIKTHGEKCMAGGKCAAIVAMESTRDDIKAALGRGKNSCG